ncbi:MAG: hypothetical protein ABIL27_06660 [candidate division WOR-3 bacterium]
MNRMGFLVFAITLLISCSSPNVGGEYGYGNMPLVELISNPSMEDVVFRIYSDKSLQTLIRESKGSYSVVVEIPEGKYYFEAWKDENGNGIIDTGDMYGADTTGIDITSYCKPCQATILLSTVTGR